MNAERLKKILRDALERPADERSVFVTQACGEDAELLAEANARLASLQSEDAFLRTGGALQMLAENQGPDEGVADRAGERIDNYLLGERLGSGGFGDVYAADQIEPVERRVAVKILKAGMDSHAVLARFEAERHALARMDHPNVASILDAGETTAGRPYFVMELVRGDSIADHCDQNKLSLEERIGLFVSVCSAVQHAHQKGVVHRDLKPSNILVTLVDGKPTPKVIDFGIAKATTGSFSDLALETRAGDLLGTPAYMSPEQASTDGQDIDTRSDIYSLGVILYQLLTGALPFDPTTLREKGYAEMLRVLREDDPPKPSDRVGINDAQSTQNAARRQTNPISLNRRVRGEMDWIILKCMEKDRNRRYDSATGLRADLQCFMRDEPVSAGPPSRTYRFRKFVKRHTIGIATLMMVTLTLLGALIHSNTQRLAIAAARDEAEDARVVAQQEASVSAAVSDFLQELISGADPIDSPDPSISLVDAVLKGAERLKDELVDQPVVRARLLRELASTLTNLGQFQAVPTLLDPTLDELKAASTVGFETIADLQIRSAYAIYRAGDYDTARSRFEATLTEITASPAAETFVHGHAFRRLGLLERRAKNPELAEQHMARAEQIYDAIPLEEGIQLAGFLSDRALVLNDVGKYSEAIEAYERSIRIFSQVSGPDSPRVGMTLSNLSDPQRRTGDMDAAVESIRLANEIYVKAWGPNYGVRQGNILTTQAIQSNELGKYDDAVEYHQRATEIYRKELGPGHSRVALSLLNHATTEQNHGHCDRAIPLFLEAREIHRKVFGEDSKWVERDNEGLAGCRETSPAR